MSAILQFVPDNRRQIVKAKLAAMLLNRCMQRDHGVASAILASGKANVSHHANQASTRDQGVKAVFPDFIQLPKELFVIFNVTQLCVGVSVLFQRPIWR